MKEIGLEYKLVAQYLSMSRTRPDTFELKNLKKEMAEKTWQYARRQMTWFKKDQKIVWLEPKINLIEKQIKKFLQT